MNDISWKTLEEVDINKQILTCSDVISFRVSDLTPVVNSIRYPGGGGGTRV